LAWSTNALYNSGQIYIVAGSGPSAPTNQSPATNIVYSSAGGGTITIKGTNGDTTSGSMSTTIELLSTTQLWTPTNMWTVVQTGGYTNGVFTFTIPAVNGTTSTYYRTKATP